MTASKKELADIIISLMDYNGPSHLTCKQRQIVSALEEDEQHTLPPAPRSYSMSKEEYAALTPEELAQAEYSFINP